MTLSGAFGHCFNTSPRRMECPYTSLCPSCCFREKICPDFLLESCPLLNKPPYVCNGCTKNRCTLEKRFYNATTAHMQYREIWVKGYVFPNYPLTIHPPGASLSNTGPIEEWHLLWQKNRQIPLPVQYALF